MGPDVPVSDPFFRVLLQAAIANQTDFVVIPSRANDHCCNDRFRFNRSIQEQLVEMVAYSSLETIDRLIPLSANNPDFQSRLLRAIVHRYRDEPTGSKVDVFNRFLQLDPANQNMILDPVMGRAAFLEGVMTLPEEEQLLFLAYLELYD